MEIQYRRFDTGLAHHVVQLTALMCMIVEEILKYDGAFDGERIAVGRHVGHIARHVLFGKTVHLGDDIVINFLSRITEHRPFAIQFSVQGNDWRGAVQTCCPDRVTYHHVVEHAMD